MDIDGTVSIEQDIIPGAKEAIDAIRDMGLRVLFFTNNSQRTRGSIAEKLKKMGIDCCEEDVVNSGYVAASYVKNKGLKDVYVSGAEGLISMFEEQGIQMVPWDKCRTLVIGMDSNYDYSKMKIAVNAALRAETIIACNEDKVYRCSEDLYCPGCGAMSSCVEFCSGKKIDTVIGKPNAPMIDHVCEVFGLEKKDLLIVGDSYESDGLSGIRNGVDAVLIGEPHKDVLSISDISELPVLLGTFN